MPNRLYATDEAPANWFALFEELSALWNNGYVELHKTLTDRKAIDSPGKIYPPVYHIELVPNGWEVITEAQMNSLYRLAAKHEAVIQLKARQRSHGAAFVAHFKHS